MSSYKYQRPKGVMYKLDSFEYIEKFNKLENPSDIVVTAFIDYKEGEAVIHENTSFRLKIWMLTVGVFELINEFDISIKEAFCDCWKAAFDKRYGTFYHRTIQIDDVDKWLALHSMIE